MKTVYIKIKIQPSVVNRQVAVVVPDDVDPEAVADALRRRPYFDCFFYDCLCDVETSEVQSDSDYFDVRYAWGAFVTNYGEIAPPAGEGGVMSSINLHATLARIRKRVKTQGKRRVSKSR
jgi:hypothetical protein